MDDLESKLSPLGLARMTPAGFAGIAAHLAGLPPVCAELCDASLRAWDPFTRLFGLDLGRREAQIPALVSVYDGSASLWGPPLCAPDDPRLPVALATALDVLDEANVALLGTVEPSRALYVPAAWTVPIRHHRFTFATQGREYLYARDGLATLAGGARKRRRAEAHRFEREHAPVVEPCGAGAREECLALLARWSGEKRIESAEVARKMKLEVGAVARMLAMVAEPAPDRRLRGIVVRVRGAVVAFSLADDVGPGEVAILAEKTASGFAGLSSFVFREAARRLAPEGSVVNAGEDWDLPGLAAAKRAFGPEAMRETLVVTRLR